MTRPFSVESSDINRLSDMQLTQLLKELLHAESFKFGIAQQAVEVALNIRVGDGGEDGRIRWNNGPDKTDFIPSRLTMFQNKATEMTAAGYANEILTAARPGHPKELKTKVEEILDEDGSYIVFTSQELNTLQKSERIAAIRKKLLGYGKDYADTCDLHIYDAAQIAGWTNQFVSTVVSVQHWAGRPVERGLKNYALWGEHEYLSYLPFASVESRRGLVTTLKEELSKPKSCFRVMGLSGLGKTRTAFQVFAENEAIRNLVVYVDANHAPTIDALVADWVTLGFRVILVVDNCEYRLHERLVREVRRESSKIALLTLDYGLDSVSAPTISFRLEQMHDDELLQLLKPIYNELLPDLDRIVSFAQGFPQMAVLLAEARLNEDPRIGELTEDELAEKLLWRRGEVENPERLKILQVCSLFDVFGIEKEAEHQLEYIADVAGVDIDSVFECIQQYADRGLIDRRGRFGQVVPKPLAIRLAGQWWARTREQRQKELIDEIPESMVGCFCNQVDKMDYHPDVKLLTEKLCGPQGPFGQAEVIFSERGSRLFRAFVNVNPNATSTAIFCTLTQLSRLQVGAVAGNTRRNLIWGLEKLCFHADLFLESAWCMLLLAAAENESWANNATGMFAQLYRTSLSGTSAEPAVRFTLLQQAMDINQIEVDMVVLRALEQAIGTHGGSRAVGAEYQGTKAPLEEWRPRTWQDIFDYWQTAFDLLLIMSGRGETQKEKVMYDIGHSIHGFVSRGRIDMLDAAIRSIVAEHGRYWPAALESIKRALEYNSGDLRDSAVSALNSWLELLNPRNADLVEKLRIVVISPPWEHQKGDDGHYTDIAAENAGKLATDVASNINALLPHIDLLLQGEQKQSYSFGRQLVLELADASELLNITLEQLVASEQTNTSFALGMFRGIYEKSPGMWQDLIDRLLLDERLVVFYPEFIRTGDIQKQHLDALLELIRNGIVPAKSAGTLRYGSVVDDIEPEIIADFCLALVEFGEEAAWPALNIAFAYCFGNETRVKRLREQLEVLVTAAPLHEGQRETATDAYHWHNIAKCLLKEHDEGLAIALANQLISACSHGYLHSDLWNYIKPLLIDLMREYGHTLWPVFSNAIAQAKGMEVYWLQQLLCRENSFSDKMPSVLSVLPAKSVISWCMEQPGLGPNFVACCVNILESVDEVQQPSELFIVLLENFGDDESVGSALTSNMASRGWSGSLVPYLEAEMAALTPLLEHKSGSVRQWVKKHIDQINEQLEYNSNLDEERTLRLS